MKQIILLITILFVLGCAADKSEGQTVCPNCGGWQVMYSQPVIVQAPQRYRQRTVTRSRGYIPGAIANAPECVAELNAIRARGRIGHFHRGYVRGARYEGTGFSTSGPMQALQNCCYYGQRVPVAYAVMRGSHRGRSGWIACIQFR